MVRSDFPCSLRAFLLYFFAVKTASCHLSPFAFTLTCLCRRRLTAPAVMHFLQDFIGVVLVLLLGMKQTEGRGRRGIHSVPIPRDRKVPIEPAMVPQNAL